MADDEWEIDEFLRNEHSKCWLCNGFYGSNHGQPVCTTCHIYLYLVNINAEDEEEEKQGSFEEKTDSGDSGNEEPDAASDFYETETQSGHRNRNWLKTSKRDSLAERIACLTIPREYEKEKLPDGLIESFPPEVLLSVFCFLDDVSLWTASRVCSRWQQLLDAETPDEKWEKFVRLRWPLFKPMYEVGSWRTLYTKLVESSPCRYCLETMVLQSTPPIEENSWRHRRLRSELKTLKFDPPEGIQATPLDRFCCHWQACIAGPQGSPYEGGNFFLYLQIPNSYPMRPPVVKFITKIFHPNISRHGDIGLDSIQHNWSLALTISKVLVSIQSLLTDPYCHVCMERTIANLYENKRPEFERIARLWTWKHAMHDYLLPCNIDLSNLSL